MNRGKLEPKFPEPGVLVELIVALSVFAALTDFGVLSNAFAAPSPSRPIPLVTQTIQIRGAPGTASCGGGYDPGVGLVDLDHGFAAGATTYDHGGFIWCETYAPYLWSQQNRTSTLFQLEGDYNWEDSTYFPSGMTPDGSTVVGGVIFFDRGTTAPWMWTADVGSVELLVLPNGYTGGNAVSVSTNGRVIAGNLRGPGRTGVNQAAAWHDGNPQILPSTYPWSAVGSNPFEAGMAYTARRTHPMSDDGSVIVGAAGAQFLGGCKATKWVNGVGKQLSTAGIQPQSSVAVFVANNGVIFGYAVLTDGRVVLMRWDSNGNPQMFQPPNGLSVVNLSSIDSNGNAAGGALAQQFSCPSCTDAACRRIPFVWGLTTGFTILPQNGSDAYNTSAVQDVSDGGGVAIGQLSTCVVGPDSPPQLGFVWRADSGVVFVNKLMAVFGQPNPDYYGATDVSRDGSRILAVGNPPQIVAQDTPDLTLYLAWPTPSPTP